MSQEQKPRRNKAEMELIMSFVLDLIAKNQTISEIKTEVIKKYNMTEVIAYRTYLRAIHKIEDLNSEKAKTIRTKRIYSLTKDIQEAYKNYQEAEDAMLALKWHEQYSKLKQAQDKYYLNNLAPEKDKEDFNITISYSPAVKKTESIEEE